jgi:hypothetical protein
MVATDCRRATRPYPIGEPYPFCLAFMRAKKLTLIHSHSMANISYSLTLHGDLSDWLFGNALALLIRHQVGRRCGAAEQARGAAIAPVTCRSEF